jgi:hypothetical protein
VNKKELDDFFEVLRWSIEFGVDTPDGRAIKQGINAIFAASSFNPRESVRLRDGSEISLSHYASRRNIQLLRASDFNTKLRERGVPNMVSTQKICRVSQNENEVRNILTEIWKDPSKTRIIINKINRKNKKLYEFEEKIQK